MSGLGLWQQYFLKLLLGTSAEKRWSDDCSDCFIRHLSSVSHQTPELTVNPLPDVSSAPFGTLPSTYTTQHTSSQLSNVLVRNWKQIQHKLQVHVGFLSCLPPGGGLKHLWGQWITLEARVAGSRWTFRKLCGAAGNSLLTQLCQS